MKRFIYILAEIATLYSILLALGAGIIWGYDGFADVGSLIFIGYAIVTLPAAIRLVLIGPKKSSLASGFYRPIRPLALVLPGVGALLRETSVPGFGKRHEFTFVYTTTSRLAAYDVVERLSAKLLASGIDHHNSGGLLVTDNAATWWIEPDFNAPRVTGWVEADKGADRRQIIQGIRDFLEHDLRLRVA